MKLVTINSWEAYPLRVERLEVGNRCAGEQLSDGVAYTGAPRRSLDKSRCWGRQATGSAPAHLGSSWGLGGVSCGQGGKDEEGCS